MGSTKRIIALALAFWALTFTAHAQSGNFGIGTLTPQQKLHVEGGTLRVSGLSGANGAVVVVDANGDMARIPGTANGDVLKWDGTKWAPGADAGGSSYSAGTGLALSGSTFSLMSGSANGQVLKWDNDNSQWVIGTDNGTTYTGVRGITVNGTDIELPVGGAINEVLKWDGTKWISGADAGGTSYSAGTGLELSGSTFKLIDGAAAGQVLKWDGTKWALASDNDANTTYTGGIGVTIDASNVISLPSGGPDGQVLTWNGTNWEARNSGSGADNWGTQVVATNATLSGDGDATPLGLAQQGAGNGQVLKWNGVTWAPANDDGKTYTAAANMGITVDNVANTIGLAPGTANGHMYMWNGSAWTLVGNGAANGQALVWNGTTWAPGNAAAQANNGLNVPAAGVHAGKVQMGGPLVQNTDVTLSNFYLSFSGRGSVGIGTTVVPAAKFHILNDIANGVTGTTYAMRVENTNANSYGAISGAANSNTAGTAAISGTHNNTTLAVFGVSGSSSSTHKQAAAIFGQGGSVIGDGTRSNGIFGQAAGFGYGVQGQQLLTPGFAATYNTAGVNGSAQNNGMIGGLFENRANNGGTGLDGTAQNFGTGLIGVGNNITPSMLSFGSGVLGLGMINGVVGMNNTTLPWTDGASILTAAAVSGQSFGEDNPGQVGVYGETNIISGLEGGAGVYGTLGTAMFVPSGIGIPGFFTGVYGIMDPSLGYGMITEGDFYGLADIFSDGTVDAAAATANVKAFTIDHPLDPANKYLRHISIESPEPMVMYRGTVTLDANGQAKVELPGYVEALATNFTYNLTPIGASGRDLHVASKVQNNSFKIAGGTPGMEVSWTLYGERHDPYVLAHRDFFEVEPMKEAYNIGRYRNPELYGATAAQRVIRTSAEHLTTEQIIARQKLAQNAYRSQQNGMRAASQERKQHLVPMNRGEEHGMRPLIQIQQGTSTQQTLQPIQR